ncbi:family S10 non peptidase ue S10 family [Echinococcus multilocularis]|uniref:Family S10 non peptidase ue S10 family n=1 Tax=Echinococcus multilocularis TaxID=6211 RepID=A0A087W0D5_ECHMU|nr:family S10 non peptidase ue S10 family [Echinococcus multilocularis]
MVIAEGVEITEANVPALCEAVWKSQVSHRLLEKVNAEIVELLERVLSAHPLDSANLESFAEAKFTSFTQSSSQWRLLFLQMLITLPGSALLTPLRNRLFPSTATITTFSLEVLLALVSTVTICCKGGTLLISDMLHDLLVQIFSSTWLPEAKITSPKKPPNLVALLDDSFSSSQQSPSTVIDPVDWRFCQLRHTLLIARQLATEDPRVTSFSYSQWWRECFSAPPDQAGVLATRRSLEFLATNLLRLLPHEMSAIYLQTQLTAALPFWLATSDPQEECCRAWREYADVGRDRLAELRMQQVSALPGIDADSAVSNVWSDEASALVNEFTRAMVEAANASSTPKVPTAIVEMHLFRGQHLREVVMPMLRSPPPTLPADQRAVCAALVRCIEACFGGSVSGSGTSCGTTLMERRALNVRVGRSGGKRARVKK